MPERSPLLSSPSALPPRPARKPMRSRAASLAIKIISPILAIYLFVELIEITDDWRMWFVGPVVIGVGVLMLYGVANSLSSRDAWETMKHDSRPPIVYLRPFRHDSHQLASAPEGVREGGVTPDVSHASSSKENDISKALIRLGPFIAVGRPGEWLAPVGGASRLYLSDDNWKQVVEPSSAVPRRSSCSRNPAKVRFGKSF
jgi:hypothetical protein